MSRSAELCLKTNPRRGRATAALLPTVTALATLGALLAVPAACAADLSGRLFRDTNGNGERDGAEEAVGGAVEVYGKRDGGGTLDVTVPVAVDGTWSLTPADITNGCYAVRVNPPAGFRTALPRRDCQGLPSPIGVHRYGSPRSLLDALRSNAVLQIGLGDSIAEPASLCSGFFPAFNATDYVGWFGDRLKCIAGAATTSNAAIGGKRSMDLLRPAGTCETGNMPRIPNPARCDNIYDTIARDPAIVSISIGGNDWLGVDVADRNAPTPAETQALVDSLVSARANLQEILSALATELPTTDVIVNTVYDNLGPGCSSARVNNVWIPIWNQMLREVVWGNGEHFSVAEVYPEYAHEDVNGSSCCGVQSLICGDNIHPIVAGARLHLEKVWDAAGGVNLGPTNPLGLTSNTSLDFPLEELVSTRYPTAAFDPQGRVPDASQALAQDGVGATIPAGDGELVLSAFDATANGIVPSHVVVAVRYRTDAPPPAGAEADGHWFEASIAGGFPPSQPSVTGWNTVIPIVGSGSTAPQPNALPSVPQWRTVRALLTKNVTDDGTSTGSYVFPAVTWADIASLEVRFRGGTRGSGADPNRVLWDAAWLEVYGTSSTSSPNPNVYRSPSPQGLVAAGNLIGSSATTFYDDPTAPPGPVLFYAVDDGRGSPARIYVTREPTPAGTRLRWN